MTRRATERYLRVEAGAVWGDRPIDQITRGDVVLLLTRLVERGSPVAANRLLGNLRSLWNWAVDEGLTETSPCIRLRKRVPELPRDRVLGDDQIRAVWAAWEQQGWPSGTFGQLLLTTGQRRLEVAGARWSEFDLDARLWTIPAERMKGGREHVVPISSLAMELLDRLPRTSSPFLFPGRRGKAISGFSVFKRRTDALIREAGHQMPAWVFHDVRRTVRSNLSRLGIGADVGEAVIAHTLGGIRQIYDRHSYLDEKRHALEAWAGLLRDILDPVAKSSRSDSAAGRRRPKLESDSEIPKLDRQLGADGKWRTHHHPPRLRAPRPPGGRTGALWREPRL